MASFVKYEPCPDCYAGKTFNERYQRVTCMTCGGWSIVQRRMTRDEVLKALGPEPTPTHSEGEP